MKIASLLALSAVLVCLVLGGLTIKVAFDQISVINTGLSALSSPVRQRLAMLDGETYRTVQTALRAARLRACGTRSAARPGCC